MRLAFSLLTVKSAKQCSVFYRVEETLDVELEGFSDVAWPPNESLIHYGGPFVHRVPHFERSCIGVDDPIGGNRIALE